jgi:hypothetical protein
MPGTDHRLAFDPTLPQRSTPMWAPVVQRRQLAIHIRQAYRNVAHLSLNHLAVLRCLSHTTDLHPLRHNHSPVIILELGDREAHTPRTVILSAADGPASVLADVLPAHPVGC